MWEVTLLFHNAITYNEDDSAIVINSKIVVQMLTSFIRYIIIRKLTVCRRYVHTLDMRAITNVPSSGWICMY